MSDILSKDFPLITNLSMTSEELAHRTNMLQGFVESGSLSSDQWIRKINLVVYKGVGTMEGASQSPTAGLDLSLLRINFNVKKATTSNPNMLYARIYNLSPQTEQQVKQFGRVSLSAGYVSNSGQIFDGTVVQYIQGKENAVDTYLDIWAGEGDQQWNTATTNRTFPAGTSVNQHIKEIVGTLTEVNPGEIRPNGGDQKSVRATTYIGMTRDKLRDLANQTTSWYYIDGNEFHMFPMMGYRRGEEVVLTPKTGLIGMPEVTPDGIHARCLLNPRLRLGGVVQIRDNNGRSGLSGVPFIPGSDVPWSGQNTTFAATGEGHTFSAAATSPTGRYTILLLEHHGDSRGTPWYSEMVCQAADAPGKFLGNAFNRSISSAPESFGNQNTAVTDTNVPT